MNNRDESDRLNVRANRVCRLGSRRSVKPFTVGVIFLALCHAQGFGAFLESGGLVVMEAEHFQTTTSASGHAWIPTNGVAGFVGTSAMRAMPNTGTTVSSGISSNSPGLAYAVQFTRTGNYKFWIRGWAVSGSDDSVYLGVDDQVSPSLSYSQTAVWMWKAATFTIPNPGPHQINLWMREDGAYVDRLLLTTNMAFTPTGVGPPESAQSVEGTDSPVVQINNPTQGSSFPAGSTVSVSADASDPDGSVVSVDFYVNGAFVTSDTSAPFGFGWTPASGAYQLSAVATDNVGNSAASAAIDVTIAAPPPPVAGAFLESGGLVVMEAEHFRTTTSTSGHAWVSTNGVAGFVGTSAMRAMPNTGTTVSSGISSNSPGLTYAVQFTHTGNYKFWIRGWAVSGSDDSVYLGVDGQVSPSLSYSQTAVWMWKAVTVTIPNPGPHQINLWMREDGAYVDRLLLTTNTVFTPTGVGPSESAQSGGETNPPPAVVADFSGVPTNGEAPLTVAFTNLGSGATNYTWDFGDGNGSAAEHPSNTYSNAGTYSVTLTAMGEGGTNVLTRNNYIVVTNPPPQVAAVRWASSSQRIYVTGPGSSTLSQIKAAVPSAPLTLVDPANAVWYLGANLFVEQDAQLKLYGPAIGGDVAELRLKSENTSSSSAFVELRADWGWLDIRNTKITSWNNAANGPDTETDTYRRAYVRARSTLDPDGVTAHESRMDIINSEICYLGSQNSESYGLTWKVVDTTAVYLPPGSTNTLFDVVNVYGDILNSRIHHNHFGIYTYGHHGGQWLNNEVDNNLRYGFDPHDDSDFLVIENNNVHHNGWHGIIASKRCDHGVMRNNVSWNNGLDLVNPHGHGIMLHRSCNDWLVEGNHSHGNADTGISIFACDRTLIRDNLCLSNANAGIRLTVGSADNWVEGNNVGGPHRYGLYLFEGDDPPEPDDNGEVGNGRCHGNTFTNNYVYDCTSDAIKLKDADSNAFLGNAFIGNNTTLRFENGADNLFSGNFVPADTFVKLIGTSTKLTSTTFKSQPRLTLQLDPYSIATFADNEGAIFDLDQDVATVVDDAGSLVIVTSTEVGTGANTVLTRNFFVVPDSGGVLVNPTTWNQSGTFSKVWTAQASSGSIQVSYVVGGLQPGVSYHVNQGSTLLATVTANAQGSIAFTTIPGTTTALTYSIVPP